MPEISNLFLVASAILLFGIFIAVGVALAYSVCEVAFMILTRLKRRLLDYVDRKYFGE
ncbi:MAG: hypothetical protein IKP64_02680 [Selenomonadaceae bacterium]|nr:hypothetical protein [Selenomonadaceae bacterium]MBR4382443.1 hypothetical protein [Selenomonadaceae bacterium]